MPVFHTKTIESILDPVAFQVSRLVILHEEAEDGNAMPDLSRPVETVSRAVENLVKVGKETIDKSEDEILRADMPQSLQRVERASKLLEEAARVLRLEPHSQRARSLLIEGSRGILQGTSQLLLCFDEFEVRKLIGTCRKVSNYLEVVEVIERMEDLVQFVKDLTPALTRLSRDVNARQRELTHQAHRMTLLRCLENLRQEAPVLISSMKIYIQLLSGQSSIGEAAGNRNYHTERMGDELREIVRVLQLTTYDEDESWDSDSLTCMKRALGAMTSKMLAAHDWLEEPGAPVGAIGERALRQILRHAERIGERSLPGERESIRKQCGDLRSMLDALCELRQARRAARAGPGSQEESLAREIGRLLRELLAACTRAIANAELGGAPQPAHTLSGRMDQAQRWLNNNIQSTSKTNRTTTTTTTSIINDFGLGEQAAQAIIDEARRLAFACQLAQLRQQMLELCDEAEQLNRLLGDASRKLRRPGQADQARQLQLKLRQLQQFVQAALVNRVVEDFIDATLALRQFSELVLGANSNRSAFDERARSLASWSARATQTGQHVASNCAQNKRLAETIGSVAGQLDSQTPQLIGAGQIRFEHPNNNSAHENFMHMRDQYESSIIKLRNLIDEALESAAFVRASEEAIRRHTQLCELAISTRQLQSMVDNAAAIARLANRVIMVARQESNNSEDGEFVARVEQASARLQELVAEMVRQAKCVATSMSDLRAHGPWRATNAELIGAVQEIGRALGPSEVGDLARMAQASAGATGGRGSATATTTTGGSNKLTKTTTTTTTTTNVFNNDNQQQQQQQQQSFANGADGPPAPPSRSSGYRSETSPRAPSLPSRMEHPQQQQQQQQTYYPYEAAQAPNANVTDDEEERFPTLQANEPIMLAAHDLHQEVKQWSSKENEIIAAAKKIALLMARLSQLVRGDTGTKRDLISCAKAIAEASQEVTRLAKEQAKLCTDRKMRTNILQVCERIPTMGTQLRILSTVKATMLGVQGSQEDQEAMDMIVGNAQNLMQSIKETVRACEAASIKIRTDQGVRVRWIRKEPWYT